MVVLPAKLRKRFGIEEGAYIIAEERDEGILIRPAAVTSIEMCTPERVAEFLLGSAVDKPSCGRNASRTSDGSRGSSSSWSRP